MQNAGCGRFFRYAFLDSQSASRKMLNAGCGFHLLIVWFVCVRNPHSAKCGVRSWLNKLSLFCDSASHKMRNVGYRMINKVFEFHACPRIPQNLISTILFTLILRSVLFPMNYKYGGLVYEVFTIFTMVICSPAWIYIQILPSNFDSVHYGFRLVIKSLYHNLNCLLWFLYTSI